MKTQSFATKDKMTARQPLRYLAVKSFGLHLDKNLIWKPGIHQNPNTVFFICDYEGRVLFVNNNFSLTDCLIDYKKSKKSILEYIHAEDVPVVIEQLVQLLHEKRESIIVEARFLCKKIYCYTKWHVGYLDEKFYFYPIKVPTSGGITKSGSKVFLKEKVDPQFIDIDALMWKMEISKTLYIWDKIVYKHLASCLNIS